MSPSRTTALLALGGTLGLTGLALSACGSSDTRAPTMLDTERVERAIERSSLAQRDLRVRVSCPSGIHQEKGLTFWCATQGARPKTRFAVTELNGSGRVHYEAR
jgi:hypothetical protein